ncbi:MAG: VWA domain-containing protein, partial [Pyrinomonadaceae bacterium]|nr:VWA domain-containing protein [Pyrinomonadaceae bacterium]
MRFQNLMLLCFLFTACGVIGNAQGVIVPIVCIRERCPRPIPRPRPIPIPNALPVKSIKIDAKINAQVATTHVEQVFRNDTDATLEGTYFFPIPESASISEFAIWENGKRLVGEVRTREEARRIYDEIVRKQRDPGLLEYAGKDLFQASIFPIPPRSDKKLEITYTQVLKAESNSVNYRYPLGTGGRNLNRQQVFFDEVSTRSTRTPTQPIGTVSGKIEIVTKDGLRNVYSPSHQIDVKKSGENRAVLSFETTGRQSPQDFQLFYGVSREDFGLSLMTYREPGKDGYFLLTLSPKDNFAEQELIAKDIVFVLDTSGSMADEGKMDKARKALLFGINGLRDNDRFNVINFAGEEHLMETGLIRADSRGKTRGATFVNRLKPVGGTNINDSLQAALKQFRDSDRPKLLVFMTDGLPTVGETNIERIIANAKSNNVQDLRLFTFGVGYDVNTALLDKLAADNSGTSDYVEPKEDIEVKIGSFFTKVNSPVLTDLQLDFGGVDTNLIYPRKTPDLFKGTQLTMIGRYQNDRDLRNIVVRLSGKDSRETRNFNYSNLNFPLRDERNEFLPRLWATRRVGWLVEQIRSNGEQKELRDEVVDLGTRYGIVTPYTSYLATDGSERTRDDVRVSPSSQRPTRRTISPRQTENLPMNGRDMGGLMGRASGADAVKDSKKQKAQQQSTQVQSIQSQIEQQNENLRDEEI